MVGFIKFMLVVTLTLLPFTILTAESKAAEGDAPAAKAKKGGGKAKGAPKGKAASASKGKQAQKAKTGKKAKKPKKAKKAKKGKKGGKGKPAKQAEKKPAEEPKEEPVDDSVEGAAKDAEEIFSDGSEDGDGSEEEEKAEEGDTADLPAEKDDENEKEEDDDKDNPYEDDDDDEKDTESSEDEEETEATKGADDLPARHRLVYSNALVGRFNPVGLEYLLDAGYRYRLYDKTDDLYKKAYLGAALTPTVNPAQARIGATLTARPLSIVSVDVGYYFNVWFGTFGHLRSFETASSDYSDTLREKTEDEGYSTTGHEVKIGLKLFYKVGPIAMRLLNHVQFGSMTLQEPSDEAIQQDQYLQKTYYDPRQDMLVANKGWMLRNDLDVLYITDFGLSAGVRGTHMYAFYNKDEHYIEGEGTDNLNSPSLRAGVVAAYEIFDKPGNAFNKPTVFINIAWWVFNRFRTGEDVRTHGDVNQAVPFILGGFKFEGDIYNFD